MCILHFIAKPQKGLLGLPQVGLVQADFLAAIIRKSKILKKKFVLLLPPAIPNITIIQRFHNNFNNFKC